MANHARYTAEHILQKLLDLLLNESDDEQKHVPLVENAGDNKNGCYQMEQFVPCSHVGVQHYYLVADT